jgi:hypothetical protein
MHSWKNPALPALIILSTATTALLFNLKNHDAKTVETVYAAIKNHQPSVFSPPVEDRRFWTTRTERPARVDPNDSQVLKQPPIATIVTGTRQECTYNTCLWLPHIEKALMALTKEPWSDHLMFRTEFTDLLATTTAAQLAFTCTTLKNSLNPQLIEAVKTEIDRRILTPYEHDLNEYQHRKLKWGKDPCPWLEERNNWNSVCIANIIYTTLALIPDNRRNAKIIANSQYALNDYFDTFESDGYLSSGIRYWNYGFSHLTLLAERLLQATHGKINLYHNPKIINIVSYPINTIIQRATKLTPGNPPTETKTETYPLFADNNNPVEPNPRTWEILKRRFNIPYPADALPETKYNHFFDLTANPPPAFKQKQTIPSPNPYRTFYPSAGVLIAKGSPDNSTLATKGGTNSEEHNHNQIGAYTFFIADTTITGTQGGLDYNRNNMILDKYAYSINNSFGQPLPVVDGQLQNNLPQAKATILSQHFTETSDTITYDLRNAYNVEGLLKLTRSITFNRTGKKRVVITDTFDADRPIQFETAIIAPLYSKIDGATILLKTVRIDPEDSNSLLTQRQPLNNMPETIGQIARYPYILKERTKSGSITYSITSL